jgi:hypothetical protein
VATGPGLTVLTRTPAGPTFLDSASLKLASAALAAPYSMTSGSGRNELTELMVTMVLAFLAIRCGSAARAVVVTRQRC